MGKSVLVYDLEIVNAIPGKNGAKLEGIKYCEGWADHAGMGISVIGAYDYKDDRYRVFCEDGFEDFRAICADRECLVGFNSIPFDNAVIGATLGLSLPENKCYDILREMWAASGLPPKFSFPSHIGYGLDLTCQANFGTEKTGDGALAPVDWQQGKIGKVIDYCLNDVKLTKQIFDAVLREQSIKSPKDGKPLRLRIPELSAT